MDSQVTNHFDSQYLKRITWNHVIKKFALMKSEDTIVKDLGS